MIQELLPPFHTYLVEESAVRSVSVVSAVSTLFLLGHDNQTLYASKFEQGTQILAKLKNRST